MRDLHAMAWAGYICPATVRDRNTQPAGLCAPANRQQGRHRLISNHQSQHACDVCTVAMPQGRAIGTVDGVIGHEIG